MRGFRLLLSVSSAFASIGPSPLRRVESTMYTKTDGIALAALICGVGAPLWLGGF